MAPPRKMTQSRAKIVIEALRNGYTIADACELAGICRETEIRYRRANPDYAKQVQEALEARVEIVEDALYKSAITGNYHAQRFFLVNRSGGRWRSEAYYEIEDGDKSAKTILLKINFLPQVSENVELIESGEDESS